VLTEERARRRQLSLALALAHLALSGMLTLAVANSYADSWVELMPRAVLFLVDLPVSVVGWFLILLLVPNVSLGWLPFPASDLQGFLAPALLHCGVGTAFYYFLPTILGYPRKKDAVA
jgi:hypothetical protein